MANIEYTFPRLVRVFARTGWNEGHNESFAYTEVNSSVQAGGDLSGAWWNRSQDRGVSASAGLQFIGHPGYNRDRGPVLVEMLRAHVDF